jgi:2-hydroxy-3-keto-5-methylthiopentenyl-1-phosphate phosphatase
VRAPWAIVCDFDGTALTDDLGSKVAVHLGDPSRYEAAEARYAAGELSFGHLLRHVFAPVRATGEEIAAFARAQARWRPGFEDFLERSAEGGVPFLIVSSGLDVYIDAVVATLSPPLRSHVQVRANRATPSPAGLTIDFHGSDCGFCGFCKGDVVRELKARGHKVVALGDGTGDRHAAEAADHVFARAGSSLARWCAARDLPHDTFTTFHDVVERFPGRASAP